MNEDALVERIRRMVERASACKPGFSPASPDAWVKPRMQAKARSTGVTLGIGDDCAIFRPRPGEDLLLKTDQLIEQVHFPSGARPEAIGARALGRALSDIAAMGGDPRCCLVALAVPSNTNERWIMAFFRGLLRLARRANTVLAGGDLAHADRIHCTVMVCGAIRRGKALRRGGARLGDAVYVSGRLGKPWDRPIQPRLALGKALVGRATACMDLSDGLARDLHRLCLASKVAAQLDRVPAVRGASIERALHGGEDYELLYTLPTGAHAPRGSIRIGAIVKGKPGEVTFEGQPLAPRGYDHFR
jgi:thiamine-monophosphate kinase